MELDTYNKEKTDNMRTTTKNTAKTFTEKEKKEIREVIKSGIILLGDRVEIRKLGSNYTIRVGPEPINKSIEIHTSRMTSIRWAESNSKQITVRLCNYADHTDRYEYELPIEQFKQAIRNAKLLELGL